VQPKGPPGSKQDEDDGGDAGFGEAVLFLEIPGAGGKGRKIVGTEEQGDGQLLEEIDKGEEGGVGGERQWAVDLRAVPNA
jgi:hypothetical protein